MEHKFVFKNIGNAALNIKSASASCGCTQPSFLFLALVPGVKGQIRVRYLSVGKSGPQEASIQVKSDAPKSPVTLKIAVDFAKKNK